ncbi:MAG: hypothetical protein KGZ88_14085 [Methylomicrobium sp.]|nr:hypothetical protein [Methylomicrobium sp.]
MSNDTDRQLTDINEKLLELTVRLDQQWERQFGLMQVISWLLARHPDESFHYLTAQAEALADNPAHEELVAVLDELTECVQHWCELRKPAPDNPG